ncbi:glycosyltransferase family 17 protein [Trichoderma citrinoviride]|uniref:Glycosyltransferase family 17 protein n=1 Tax=Trichoderma citrinoviride TaxID=58853 RepID=A0A2T4AZV4_9HYPO|nr:glycosyltransferase family 17 protein [Trichoderma citrinoviride]PTB62593.1 glycosyltransferase family 17 protein [Trichoderma citrinoviride]
MTSRAASLVFAAGLLSLSLWLLLGQPLLAPHPDRGRISNLDLVLGDSLPPRLNLCFATMEQFLNKMASFSHVWMNQDEYRDRDNIAKAVREGRDVWGRDIDTFERIERNQDIPAVLRREGDKYRYLLDRSGKSAGFTDYP